MYEKIELFCVTYMVFSKYSHILYTLLHYTIYIINYYIVYVVKNIIKKTKQKKLVGAEVDYMNKSTLQRLS